MKCDLKNSIIFSVLFPDLIFLKSRGPIVIRGVPRDSRRDQDQEVQAQPIVHETRQRNHQGHESSSG